MRPLLLSLAVLLLPQAARASGWNDFEQPIGDGYSIVRANAGCVVLTHARSGVIPGGENCPIVGFAVTPAHVFTRHAGPAGTDTYYVTDKPSDRVVGPLTAAAFAANPDVVRAGTVTWGVPKNPHPEVARAGQQWFVAVILVVIGGPVLLAVVGVCLIVLTARRRRRLRPANAS